MLTLLGLIPGVGPIILFLKANRWADYLLGAVVLALAVAGLVFGLIHHGKAEQGAKDKAEAAVAIEKAKAINTRATAKSEADATKDAAAVVSVTEDLKNAYAQVPDSAPSGVRLAAACERLRHTDQARLPEFSKVCGPSAAGGAQAGH